jgi:hypothetical protein
MGNMVAMKGRVVGTNGLLRLQSFILPSFVCDFLSLILFIRKQISLLPSENEDEGFETSESD